MATTNVGPSFQGCPFQAPDQKWQARFFCYVASLTLSLAHSSASAFLCLHDMVLVHQGGCEKTAEGKCGKMLPDNTGACDSEGKLIWSGTKKGIYD